METRESPAGAHPHAAVATRKQRMTHTVIPEQPLCLAVVPPLLAVKHVDAIIRARPEPSARIGHKRSYFIGLQPVLFRQVLPAWAVSIESESPDANRFDIAEPDAAIGSFGDFVQRVLLHTLFLPEP